MVYGVVTEICVLFAVRGLLKAGVKVIVATDAIEALKADACEGGAGRDLQRRRDAGALNGDLHGVGGGSISESNRSATGRAAQWF